MSEGRHPKSPAPARLAAEEDLLLSNQARDELLAALDSGEGRAEDVRLAAEWHRERRKRGGF